MKPKSLTPKPEVVSPVEHIERARAAIQAQAPDRGLSVQMELAWNKLRSASRLLTGTQTYRS